MDHNRYHLQKPKDVYGNVWHVSQESICVLTRHYAKRRSDSLKDNELRTHPLQEPLLMLQLLGLQVVLDDFFGDHKPYYSYYFFEQCYSWQTCRWSSPGCLGGGGRAVRRSRHCRMKGCQWRDLIYGKSGNKVAGSFCQQLTPRGGSNPLVKIIVKLHIHWTYFKGTYYTQAI